jgi:hypothetical protein
MKIIKTLSAVLLSGMILLSPLMAQNSKVSNAIQAFADGDYERTYELAGDALASLDQLSGDYVSAAYAKCPDRKLF